MPSKKTTIATLEHQAEAQTTATEASSMIDVRSIPSRLKQIAAGSSRLYHRDFLGLSWLASYVADVDVVCTEVERLKAQVAVRDEVVTLARAYRTAADESEDDGEDERTMDAGYAFFNALARLDALEHAQRNAQAEVKS